MILALILLAAIFAAGFMSNRKLTVYSPDDGLIPVPREWQDPRS